MQTVQRNFAESLMDPRISPRKAFMAVKEFSYKEPEVRKNADGEIMEIVSLSMEMGEGGKRSVLFAEKHTKGKNVDYNIWIENVEVKVA